MYYGVSFLYCDNIRMTHSDISRCYNAINVYRCSDSLLYTNMLEDNVFGISTYAINSSEIWRNDIYNSTRAGLYIRAIGDGLKVNNNQIRNGYAGVRVSGNYIDTGGEPLVIDGNGFSNNMYGIMFSRVQHVYATGNVIENSTNVGLALAAIEDCRFDNNTIQYNNWGIQLINYGDYSGLNGNNTFDNNYFNNYQQVMVLTEELPMGDFEKEDIKVPPGREHIKETEISVDEEQSGNTNLQNYWNITKSAGTNIAGGPYLGGNYWASPDGTGFSQTHEDRGDGFCDEPYVFDQWNTDYLPLHTYTPKPAFYADFSVSPASGTAPLTVHCTDKSGGSPDEVCIQLRGRDHRHRGRIPRTRTGTREITPITLSVTKYNTSTHSMMMANKTRAGAVTVETVPFVAPVAGFTASPTVGLAPPFSAVHRPVNRKPHEV